MALVTALETVKALCGLFDTRSRGRGVWPAVR